MTDRRGGEVPPEPSSAAATGPRLSKADLDRVFGDVLADTTRDERDDGDSAGGRARRGGQSRHDDDLRRDVPPHHG